VSLSLDQKYLYASTLPEFSNISKAVEGLLLIAFILAAMLFSSRVGVF